jgi:hypothetical protein
MPGMNSKYTGFLYVNVDGTNDATPDATSSGNYKIYCHPFSGEFSNNDSDFSKPLAWEVGFFNTTNDTETLVPITFSHPEDDAITMVRNESWEYINSTTYGIDMSVFDNNCVENEALVPVFRYHLYKFIPFMNTNLDTGYAGIQFSSMNPDNDLLEKYPFNLNKWDGLPTWLSEESLFVNIWLCMQFITLLPTRKKIQLLVKQLDCYLIWDTIVLKQQKMKQRVGYIIYPMILVNMITTRLQNIQSRDVLSHVYVIYQQLLFS